MFTRPTDDTASDSHPIGTRREPPASVRRALESCGRRPLRVAVSGGRDSVLLLDLLDDWCRSRGLSLAVLYFHHGSGPHADQAQAFVAELARLRNLPFLAGRDRPGSERSRNREAAWREARYAWFSQVLDPEAVLLTAHHADDRLETHLMALERGAGLAGLDPMGGDLRPFARGYLLRPLLEITRAEITREVQARRLRWLEDPTNEDPGRRRHRLRRLLASLSEDGTVVQTAAAHSLAEISAGAARLALLDATLLATALRGHVLDVERLQGLTPHERRAVLRRWLVHHGGGRLPRSRLALLEAWAGGSGSRAGLVHGEGGTDYRLCAHGLYPLGPLPPTPPRDWESSFDAQGLATLPTGHGRLRIWGHPPGPWRVRFRRGGEILRWGKGSTRLQEFLRRRGVPPWLRDHLPLLVLSDRSGGGGEEIVVVAPDWSAPGWRDAGGRFRWMVDSPALLWALLDAEAWRRRGDFADGQRRSGAERRNP